MINHDLVEQLSISDENVHRIKLLQEDRDSLLAQPWEHAETPLMAQERLQSIEFALQSTWGFALDNSFHRLYTYMYGCKCDLVKGSSLFRVSPSCPYHGVEPATSWDDSRFLE